MAGACMVGACMVGDMHGGGMHGRGHACLWACVAGECAWQGGCVAGETATAADGTHPTGMVSCLMIFLNLIHGETLADVQYPKYATESFSRINISI